MRASLAWVADLGIAPVVTLLPADQAETTHTPAGRLVAVCPAVTNDDINCANCGICAVGHRQAIIGFTAHGSGARQAQQVFNARRKSPIESRTDDRKAPVSVS